MSLSTNLSLTLVCFFFATALAAKRCKCTRPAHGFTHHIVVANRGSGTISIINPKNFRVVLNYTLPNNGEPMYFGVSLNMPELWVGDRANNRIVILKLVGRKLELDDYLPTPAGLFHTMNTQETFDDYPIVWTTCDIDNLTVVYDATTRRKLAEIPRPNVVARLGGIPHDVSANSQYGFITYIGNSDGSGYVASYNARTFKLIKILKTVDDPHVAIRDTTELAIAAQGGDVLFVSIPDLKVLRRHRNLPSPHGAVIQLPLKYLYVTNIAEDGDNALMTYNMQTYKPLKCPMVKTSRPVPHNPKTSRDSSRIFITHSGATSDVVSVFDIASGGCPLPSSEKLITTGLNPFGICLLPESPTVPNTNKPL